GQGPRGDRRQAARVHRGAAGVLRRHRAGGSGGARERVAQGAGRHLPGRGRAHGGLPRPHGERRGDDRAPARERPDRGDVLLLRPVAERGAAPRPGPGGRAVRRRVRRLGSPVPGEPRREGRRRRRRHPGGELVRLRPPAARAGVGAGHPHAEHGSPRTRGRRRVPPQQEPGQHRRVARVRRRPGCRAAGV
ncbi:MAG: hypothetical protein SCL24.07, partial [uncultured Nocardioidaceae bacterium]